MTASRSLVQSGRPPRRLEPPRGPASPSDFSTRVRANLWCCPSRSVRPAISLSGLRANDRLGCLRTRDASSGGVATATLRFAAAYRAAIGRVRTARSSKSSALRADSSLSGIPSPIRFTPFPIPLGGPNRYHVAVQFHGLPLRGRDDLGDVQEPSLLELVDLPIARGDRDVILVADLLHGP